MVIGIVTHTSNKRKKRQVIKSWGNYVSLVVVGEDVRVEQVGALSRKTLVGKFLGRKMNVYILSALVQSHWMSLLGYGPICHMLDKGWIGFIIRTKGDALRILKDH